MAERNQTGTRLARKKVAVTGGTGFIGKKIIDRLLEDGHTPISLQRSSMDMGCVETRYFDLSIPDTIQTKLVHDVDVVIHCAALVHCRGADEVAHRKLNFEATKQFFEICKLSEVEKFVFISTVGVYGLNCADTVIDVHATPTPRSPYAKAKLNSEMLLLDQETTIDVSVIRLPLVYGKYAPGNLGALEKLAKTKLPLPFVNAHNRRSMVSVEVVAREVSIAAADRQTHLGLNILAERQPYSTKEIVAAMRAENGMSPLLFSIPKPFMRLLLSAVGKRTMYEQLYKDLEFASTIEWE